MNEEEIRELRPVFSISAAMRFGSSYSFGSLIRNGEPRCPAPSPYQICTLVGPRKEYRTAISGFPSPSKSPVTAPLRKPLDGGLYGAMVCPLVKLPLPLLIHNCSVFVGPPTSSTRSVLLS